MHKLVQDSISTNKACIKLGPIDTLLAAFDAHMFHHDGYGPGTKAPGPPGPGRSTPWDVLGPGPISIMAEQMFSLKGNHQAITINIQVFVQIDYTTSPKYQTKT